MNFDTSSIEIGKAKDVLPFGCYICTSTYKTKGVGRFFISISRAVEGLSVGLN
jgi:hypothetical protein